MSNSLIGEPHGKIRQVNYDTLQANSSPLQKQSRVSSLVRNPIKIVVDIIGEDGAVHQQIINQQRENMNVQVKTNSFRVSKSLNKQHKTLYQRLSKGEKAQSKPLFARSLVFNRFSYDNYQQLPIPSTIKSKSSSQRSLKPGHKNIEIVFCESKYPQFIQKTNAKIQDLYKQEQLRDHQYHKNLLKTSINLVKSHERQSSPRKSQKTNLANCLKEYATLEKLSMFMESDQRRREECLCYSVEKDPSRNLLLDIITHRFNFLKKMNRRCRQSIYKCLLGREVNALTKINIQEYMKISEMFVGRDASNIQVATLIYLFLFGENAPTLDSAQKKLEVLNGQMHKMKVILEELYQLLNNSNNGYLVDELSKRERLLRLFIDYIIEKD